MVAPPLPEFSLSKVMNGRRRRVNRSRTRIATMFREYDASTAFSMTQGKVVARRQVNFAGA